MHTGGSSDEWGVPANMFGHTPEPFIAALGRVVMIGAMIEEMFGHVVATMTARPQNQLAGKALGQLRAMFDTSAARQPVSERVRAARATTEELMERRNELVHSCWPYNGDGVLRGWRAKRPPKAASTGAEAADVIEWVEFTLDDLRTLIVGMAAHWSELQALISSGDLDPHRPPATAGP